VARSTLPFCDAKVASVVNIGQAAKASGISAKMMRYYESIGLVPQVGRKTSGYRDYDEADVHRMRFIKTARDLGFSLEQVRELLKLWSDRNRDGAEVKTLARAYIAELETRAAELAAIINSLRRLAHACASNHES